MEPTLKRRAFSLGAAGPAETLRCARGDGVGGLRWRRGAGAAIICHPEGAARRISRVRMEPTLKRPAFSLGATVPAETLRCAQGDAGEDGAQPGGSRASRRGLYQKHQAFVLTAAESAASLRCAAQGGGVEAQGNSEGARGLRCFRSSGAANLWYDPIKSTGGA